MKVPNGTAAVVPLEKLTDYLLSPTHPVGRHKARVFRAVGYELANPEDLRRELKELAVTQEVAATEDTAFGTKYTVDGAIPTPSGSDLLLRSVWIIEQGSTVPRLVTAYAL
jgi:hypothetical protein